MLYCTYVPFKDNLLNTLADSFVNCVCTYEPVMTACTNYNYVLATMVLPGTDSVHTVMNTITNVTGSINCLGMYIEVG